MTSAWESKGYKFPRAIFCYFGIVSYDPDRPDLTGEQGGTMELKGSKTEKNLLGGIYRRIAGTHAVQFLCERRKKGRV